MVSTKRASNGDRKIRGRNRNKANVNTKTSVPEEQKMNNVDGISYLTNDTKVKISVSPKEIWKKHLEDTTVPENFITNTTRTEKTAFSPEFEKYLEMSNYGEKLMAHFFNGSRISPGSEGGLSLSDNSHRPKNGCKRNHPSHSNDGESTNSKNADDIVMPLKRKKKETSCIKPQIYYDALDISEQHSHSRKDGNMSKSTESSGSSFIKNIAPEHKFKKKKYAVIKQDIFDIMSPTVVPQPKQLMKGTWSKNGNLNANSEISKSCDQPKIFEPRSSTDSLLNIKPKDALRKKAPRAPGKNAFDSLIVTCNNIDHTAGTENKTGNISSGSASGIAPAAVNVRHNLKQRNLKCGIFDSVVLNHLVEEPIPNMQANGNVPCTSEQQSEDISVGMDVLKASASAKIVGKTKQKHVQHNLFKSVVGNDYENSEQNVEEQNNDICMAEKCDQNNLAAKTKESMDISTTNLYVMEVLKTKFRSIPRQTFDHSEILGHSHNSQSIEGRKQTNDGDNNRSIDKLVERKFLRSTLGTSEYNYPTSLGFGRSGESHSDSLTVSKFKPKITSSKMHLAKDEVAEQCPTTLAALQQKVASDRLNLTHNGKQIVHSDNLIVCQSNSTDHESDETNYKKRKKYYISVCDNSVLSSDLTFEPDNVPHSTMVQSSSNKKHPPPAMYKMESKTRRSLLHSFDDSKQVSTERGEIINVGTKNASIRSDIFTLNGRESENEPAKENERNDTGMKYSDLQTNEHHSCIVEKDTHFGNKISAPEDLHGVSDNEPVADSTPPDVMVTLKSTLPAGDGDVSKVFRNVICKTKSLAKSSSINSQEGLSTADSRNEKKGQGNSKIVPDKLKKSPENIVFDEIIKPQSMGCNTKCSVPLPCTGNVSSHSSSKTYGNSYRHVETEHISLKDTLAEKINTSKIEELNVRKSDKVSLRSEKRKPSDYSYVAVSSSKLNETDVLNSKNCSNLKRDSKTTATFIENKSDYAGARDCSEESYCTQKGTPELRELSSSSSSSSLLASSINKMSHKENFSLNITNSSKAKIKDNIKNSAASNVSNAKIVLSDSPHISDANNDKRCDDFDNLHRNRQVENEKGTYTNTQPHLTVDDCVNSAQGESSVIIGEQRELSRQFLSASHANTSHKESFSVNIENGCNARRKESNKKSVVRNLSNAKITPSYSSGLSNTNIDNRPYDYLKESLHRNGQNENERQSYPNTQPQLVADNEPNSTEGERPVIIREPLKENKLTTHQKKLDTKQTQAKPKERARFMIDGEPYSKPKLVRPKGWINQRFYNHILPKFDKKYGLRGSVKCEEFVKLLCAEVTACIRKRKNWDVHVYNVQELLSKYLSLNTFAHYLIFGEKYLPDEYVFKMGLTYEKRYKNK